jgi:DNA-binding NtrC family response regulator
VIVCGKLIILLNRGREEVRNIFVVTDNAAISRSVIAALAHIEAGDMSISCCRTYIDTVAYLKQEIPITLAVLDLYLHGAPVGTEIAKAIKARYPEASLIFFTRHSAEAKKLISMDELPVMAIIDKLSIGASGKIVESAKTIFKEVAV